LGLAKVTIVKIFSKIRHYVHAVHVCTTGLYAAITLTASIPTSTEKPYFVVLAKHRTAP